jgi:carbamate kinase
MLVDVALGGVELAAAHDVVVTHGNGPQVGFLGLQGEAYPAAKPYPLDVLGAETEGMIGYLLDQELVNRLEGRRPVATLLTQVIVDDPDPAFNRPEKFVGPIYSERGWAGFGTADARDLNDVRVDDLRDVVFARGSMGSKVQAGCRFAERTGGIAGIGALADAAAILRRERGTRIRARSGVTA